MSVISRSEDFFGDGPPPTLRPSTREYFPVFTEESLASRLQQHPFHIATLLRLENILPIRKTHAVLLNSFLNCKFEIQQRLMKEVLIVGGVETSTATAICSIARRDFIAHPQFKRFSNLNYSIPYDAASWLTPQYLIGLMIDRMKLKPAREILELGAGAGYHMLCLHRCLHEEAKLYGIEINQRYSEFGNKTLLGLGVNNAVKLIYGDGSSGWPQAGKTFDCIYCTAALKSPLLELPLFQLREGGIVQCVRALSENEYEKYPLSSKIRAMFPTYLDYQRGDWRNFCCISTFQEYKGDLIEQDRLYDVRFVYFHHDMSKESAVLPDPFQGLFEI